VREREAGVGTWAYLEVEGYNLVEFIPNSWFFSELVE